MVDNGGGLRLLPATPPTGCTVRLDLPLANGQPLPGRTGHDAPRHLVDPTEPARRNAS
jgi:hypothetical protein